MFRSTEKNNKIECSGAEDHYDPSIHPVVWSLGNVIDQLDLTKEQRETLIILLARILQGIQIRLWPETPVTSLRELAKDHHSSLCTQKEALLETIREAEEVYEASESQFGEVWKTYTAFVYTVDRFPDPNSESGKEYRDLKRKYEKSRVENYTALFRLMSLRRQLEGLDKQLNALDQGLNEINELTPQKLGIL